MRICLFRPEIAGNFGTIIRTLACFGLAEIDVIMPMGFHISSQELKRSMMDYGGNFAINKFADFAEYREKFLQSRIILCTTKSTNNFDKIEYIESDILLFGSEGGGVADEVREMVDLDASIPMKEGFRSMNLAVSVGIIAHFAIKNIGAL